jgi:hypothetical protein
MYDGHGFSLNSIPAVSCIEMIYTPQYNQNVLFSGATKKYEWDNAGLITKTGISSIYVNGIDRTAETNVWNFLVVDTPQHIVGYLNKVYREAMRDPEVQEQLKSRAVMAVDGSPDDAEKYITRQINNCKPIVEKFYKAPQ